MLQDERITTDAKPPATPFPGDLRDWFAGHAGEEAFRLLTAFYGDDWMGSNCSDAINTFTETKLAIADAMLDKLDKLDKDTEATEGNG